MPVFFYRAKNLRGEEEKGILQAENSSSLARILRQKGYFLLSAKERTSGEKSHTKLSRFNFFSKILGVSLTEKLFFTRNLGVMIKTGVALPRAFEILSMQAKSEKLKRALREISRKIIKGRNLSESLSGYPDIFSKLYQETIKVGEETGNLEQSLQILGLQMEREYNIKSSIKTAMVYPVVVLVMTFAIGIFMLIYAIPKLEAAFEELEMDLPFTTRTILSTADFMVKKWPLVLIIFAGLGFLLFFVLKSKKGGKFKSKISLKIPLVSKIIKQTNSALALRTLSSLLEAGVPIVRSLEVASGSLTNFFFKKSLLESAKIVKRGKKLSEVLGSYENLYPPMVLQMIKVGEETGESSEVLKKLAEFYEEEVSNATKKLSSVIEPVLILFIGGIVGFFAISVMQPMFSIMGGI